MAAVSQRRPAGSLCDHFLHVHAAIRIMPGRSALSYSAARKAG
jgi:hypothetical protein